MNLEQLVVSNEAPSPYNNCCEIFKVSLIILWPVGVIGLSTCSKSHDPLINSFHCVCKFELEVTKFCQKDYQPELKLK